MNPLHFQEKTWSILSSDNESYGYWSHKVSLQQEHHKKCMQLQLWNAVVNGIHLTLDTHHSKEHSFLSQVVPEIHLENLILYPSLG